MTNTDHLLANGDTIVVVGATEAGFNGEFTITKVRADYTDVYGNLHTNFDITYTSPVSGNATATSSTYLRFFNWGRSDEFYNKVVNTLNKQILYTFLGTPWWAASKRFGLRPYFDMVNMEPANMVYYIEYCQALATRYPLITHYECSNEPSWTTYINAISVPGNDYAITVDLFNSADFSGLRVGCSVECAGISKTAQVTSIVASQYKCTITFDIVRTGVVSGDLYPSVYYHRNVVSFTPLLRTSGIVTTKATVTLNNVSNIILG